MISNIKLQGLSVCYQHYTMQNRCCCISAGVDPVDQEDIQNFFDQYLGGK